MYHGAHYTQASTRQNTLYVVHVLPCIQLSNESPYPHCNGLQMRSHTMRIAENCIDWLHLTTIDESTYHHVPIGLSVHVDANMRKAAGTGSYLR